ncbi:MAG: GDP-mannose 4,6-dehydratase, partial [Patescibacteria group bacterium]
MKILVTGGAGFIGSNFIRHILTTERDVSVVNFDKLTYAGNLENLRDVENDSRYTFVKGDIADAAAVDAVMKGVDAVVNYAAETHVDRSIMDPKAFLATDIMGTWTLLEAVRR